MMILRTRKEQYLNEIVGNGNTAPGTPYTREELFFADILGEVNAPVPVTRIEIYLAKIANKYSGEMPEPKTRIEKFIARAAGMDVIIPTPITREEMLWANYALIVEKELSGTPPLTFTAKKTGTLKNYRIYGNTVNGESVGDRTANLFDINSPLLYHASISKADAEITTDMFPYSTGGSRRCIFIPVEPNTTYTFSCRTAGDKLVIAAYNQRYTKAQLDLYTIDNRLISDGEIIFDIQKGYTLYTFTTSATTNMIGIYYQLNISPTDIMLNLGSTALPYEPYGYKVPVTVSNGTDTLTTPIYLPEQIKKVGDEAEYIDYAEQKQHRVRKNLFNIETDIISLGFQYGTVAIYSDPTVKGFLKECEPNTAYTISRKTSSNNRFSIGFSAEEPSNTSAVVLLSYTTPLDTSTTSLTLISPANAKYICCYLSNRGDDITEALEIMLEKNDRATDYEPYIENTEVDVILPGIAVTAGTNMLSVGTEVQPSNVYIKYEGAR